MSNSKLSREQKAERKAMLADLADAGGTLATVGRFTVAISPEGKGLRMARMSVAVASPDEQKIRRKVGEFHALTRLYDLQSVPVPRDFDAQDLAEMMSQTDGGYQFGLEPEDTPLD
jgi:hypothetical protein